MSNCFPSWMLLMANSHSDSVAQCPKAPWAVSIPCFQVPKVSQSQKHRPFPEMVLCYHLPRQEEQQNVFFTKGRLQHRSSHCQWMDLRVAGCVDLSCSQNWQSIAKVVIHCYGVFIFPLPSQEARDECGTVFCFSVALDSLWFSANLLSLS
jgi:hypothetical protein